MKDKPTIDILMRPLAWHALRRDFDYDGFAVDLGRSWAYNIITQGLQRTYKASPWEFSRQPKDAVKGKIYISKYDADRFGHFMSLTRQANFACIIYEMERTRLCQLTAFAHVIGGISRDAAMRHFLDIDNISEEELAYQTLRKHYQRNYRVKESILYNSINVLREE